MDYYSESDGSVDRKVMVSICPTPLGLTIQKCDYRGKTVYFCLIMFSIITSFSIKGTIL